MTNNIVAEFSCSVWKKSEEERASSLGFNVGDFKVYPVINGSTFNEEYNETLDSATILLSQIKKEDRLSNIKPYDYVRIYDTSSAFDPDTGKYDFDKIFLVDNFNEQENNIKEHLFGYTINLMSETKWLEKIQCPNLTITHKVNEDGTTTKKTIYQHIKQYMELFVPRIKMFNGSGWSYEPLIKCPSQYEEDGVTETAFYKKFKITCADLAFTAPTLRQLLTNIMLQVGCIPVVHNRTLGFLDFQAQTHEFGGEHGYDVDNTVNFIKRSLSSDSFANTLVNISENVLDSGNEVICETLGFRDKNRVLLKNKENLFLETSFPIYKINKCILHGPGRYTGNLSSSYGCFRGLYVSHGVSTLGGYKWPIIYYNEAIIENNTATIKFRLNEEISNPNISVEVGKIIFWSKNNTGYHTVEIRDFDNFVMNNNTMMSQDNYAYYDNYYATLDYHHLSTKSILRTFNNLDSSVSAFMFSGNFIDLNTGEIKPFTFIKFANNDSYVDYHDIYMLDYRDAADQQYDIRHMWGMTVRADACIARVSLSSVTGFQSWDITKLVVEQSIRQLLDTNFERMNSELPKNDKTKWSIDTLAKYIYGTVGYSIGSTKIEGFSDVFNVGEATATGWMQYEYTYLENIVHFLENSEAEISPLTYVLYNYFEDLGNYYIYKESGDVEETDDYERPPITNNLNSASQYDKYNLISSSFEYYDINTNSFGTDDPKYFSAFFVDLYYQPLNSFNLAYSKKIEDIDIPIAQYDGNASGLSDFDRLSLHEQEQVDRIGNETLSINQRTRDYSKIQDFKNGPLVFMDDTNRSGSIGPEDKGVKYVIFKRSFTINNNCYNASYVGSKDAVLKDYFTSIRTKYRAYQYVDYNSSVLRKERDTFFVRVSSNYYNGDDRIWLGNYNTKKPENISYWIYDVTHTSGEKQNISYECEYAIGIKNVVQNGVSKKEKQSQRTKNSVSLITNKNSLGLIYECTDNVGAGPYIEQVTKNSKIGGTPQTWQIWDEPYSISHTVSYVSFIDFYGQVNVGSGTAVLIQNIQNIEKSPMIDISFIDLYGSDYVVFNVVDDNTKPVGSYTNVERTFYKDYAERINHTVQFTYYAPDNDVLFGEDFISGTPLIGRFENIFNAIYGSYDYDNFTINVNRHEVPENDTMIIGSNTGEIVLDESIETVKLVDSSTLPTSTWIYEHTYEFIYAGMDNAEKILFALENYVVETTQAYLSCSIIHYEKENKIVCKIRNHYSNTGWYRIIIPYFYNDIVTNTIDDNSIPVLRVYWSGYNVIKMCNKDTNGEVIDIAVFKRPESEPEYTDYYFTINDTKTDYVLAEKNGILYRRYVVSKNTLSRTVENSPDIYDEEE